MLVRKATSVVGERIVSLRRIGLCIVIIIVSTLAFSQNDPSNLRVTMSFSNTPIREAVSRLFQGRASVIVYSEVQGEVTGDYQNQWFEIILQHICRAAGATYRIDGGVYEIVNNVVWDDLRTGPP